MNQTQKNTLHSAIMGAFTRFNRNGHNELMSVTPDELAFALLNRRKLLKDSLQGVIRNLEAEEDSPLQS